MLQNELSADSLAAIYLTLQIAAVTTCLLLLLATPFAYWLAKTSSRMKPLIEAVVALPLVLPPTVLGFYLLVLLAPASPFGGWILETFGLSLVFSFEGLVLGSLLYSMPFVVQPLQNAFEALDQRITESTTMLGVPPWVNFFKVELPQIYNGLLTASVLGFSHTVGEFGVVLMIGGNIPGKTQVVSIAIFDQVESMNYESAHQLALGLLISSFIALLVVYGFRYQNGQKP